MWLIYIIAYLSIEDISFIKINTIVFFLKNDFIVIYLHNFLILIYRFHVRKKDLKLNKYLNNLKYRFFEFSFIGNLIYRMIKLKK